MEKAEPATGKTSGYVLIDTMTGHVVGSNVPVTLEPQTWLLAQHGLVYGYHCGSDNGYFLGGGIRLAHPAELLQLTRANTFPINVVTAVVAQHMAAMHDRKYYQVTEYFTPEWMHQDPRYGTISLTPGDILWVKAKQRGKWGVCHVLKRPTVGGDTNFLIEETQSVVLADLYSLVLAPMSAEDYFLQRCNMVLGNPDLVDGVSPECYESKGE